MQFKQQSNNAINPYSFFVFILKRLYKCDGTIQNNYLRKLQHKVLYNLSDTFHYMRKNIYESKFPCK